MRLGTNFRSRTARDYIYNPDPSPDAPKAYEKFPFIDEEDWKLFVIQKTSEEAMVYLNCLLILIILHVYVCM